jgi:hypothetical protein
VSERPPNGGGGPGPQPRRVSALRGFAWWVDGWRLFMRKPLTWIAYTAMTWALVVASNVHPMLIALVAVALQGLLAGWAIACEAAAAGRSTPLSMLFEGFRRRPADLVVLGGVYLLANIVIGMVMLGIGGEPLRVALTDPTSVTPEMLQDLQGRLIIALLLVVAIGIPFGAATWFAPIAVVQDGLRPPLALLASLRAVLRNALAFTVYGLVAVPPLMLLFLVASALGLSRAAATQVAFWVLLPLLVTSVWCSWQEVRPVGVEGAGRDAKG